MVFNTGTPGSENAMECHNPVPAPKHGPCQGLAASCRPPQTGPTTQIDTSASGRDAIRQAGPGEPPPVRAWPWRPGPVRPVPMNCDQGNTSGPGLLPRIHRPGPRQERMGRKKMRRRARRILPATCLPAPTGRRRAGGWPFHRLRCSGSASGRLRPPASSRRSGSSHCRAIPDPPGWRTLRPRSSSPDRRRHAR